MTSALGKEIKTLRRQLAEQESRLKALQNQRALDRSVEYLSQVFLTREEYPPFKDMTRRLEAFERRLERTERDIRRQVDTIEADAVEQRKLQIMG